MKLRLAVTAGTFLLAGIASAATSYPSREAPKAVSGSYLDLTSCAFSEEAARAQLDAALRLPDSERGVVVEHSPCRVDTIKPAPSRIDERYRR